VTHDDNIYCASIASHGKNDNKNFWLEESRVGGSGMGGTRREGMTGLPQISKHGQACAYDEQGGWFNHPDLSLTRSLGLGLELGSVE